MSVPLVVFDLDGTLINSRRDLAIAVNSTLADFGAPALAEDVVGDLVGDGAAVLVARAFRASGLDAPGPEALPRFIAHYADHLVDHTRPYPGIPELLETAGRQARLAVLTNKPLVATQQTLAALDLSRYFSLVIGGDEACGRKPDPAGLRLLMEAAGTTSAETLMVGDSHVDLETAHRAGVPACLVRYGFGFRESLLGQLGPDDFSVESAAELAAWIVEVGRAGS